MKDLPPWLKHGTVWMLLAMVVFVGVQAWQAQQSAARFVITGSNLEIQRSGDGHYHWPGELTGPGGTRALEFLIDTGATGTAIPLDLARALRLPQVGAVQSNTAGGVVQGQVVLADLVLEGGISVQRLRLTALPDLSAPLLGMDVLSRLRWEQGQGVIKFRLPAAGP
jgi:aspartyl protease family protein